MSRQSRHRLITTIAGISTALLALSGCSGNTSGDQDSGSGVPTPSNTADINYMSPEGSPNESLRSQLPESVTSTNTLVIATDATIGEPFASYDTDNVSMVGIAPDLAAEMGDRLGVNIELHQVVFANLIPGLKADRYAFSVAPMLRTDERQNEVDFIDFLQGGSAFIISKNSEVSSSLTPADACGMKIGYAAGSVEEISMADQSETCVSEGKDPVEGHAYQTNNEGILALTSARIDSYATAAAQAGYIALTDNEQLEVSGEAFRGGFSGMAFPKESSMLPVITNTFQELINDGTYQSILESYGVDYLAVEAAEAQVKG